MANYGGTYHSSFDPNNKSSSGKMIPIEIATHENHTCGGRQQEEMDFSI
ncbi:MAG: hypothetical protein WCC17_19780 [Candidatus Nitrosopolaris sp.]